MGLAERKEVNLDFSKEDDEKRQGTQNPASEFVFEVLWRSLECFKETSKTHQHSRCFYKKSFHVISTSQSLGFESSFPRCCSGSTALSCLRWFGCLNLRWSFALGSWDHASFLGWSKSFHHPNWSCVASWVKGTAQHPWELRNQVAELISAPSVLQRWHSGVQWKILLPTWLSFASRAPKWWGFRVLWRLNVSSRYESRSHGTAIELSRCAKCGRSEIKGSRVGPAMSSWGWLVKPIGRRTMKDIFCRQSRYHPPRSSSHTHPHWWAGGICTKIMKDYEGL